ncbi:MAG: hypothetical protein ACE5K1_11285 [Acidiferrobacterales bacterium]
MGRRIERLIALVLVGLLGLNYPLLSLFSEGGLFFGIPLLYLYLFVFWAVFILFAGLIAETKAHEPQQPRATAASEKNNAGR